MLIVIPRREIWTRQPQQVVGIDWSNPLTRGLVGTYNATYGDAVTRATVTRVGSVAPRVFNSGVLLTGYAGSGGIATNYDIVNHPLVTGAFSVVMTVKFVFSAANNQSFISQGGSGSGKGWDIVVAANTNTLSLVFGGVAIYTIGASALISGVEQRIVVVVSGNGGTATGYVNGVSVGSAAVGTMLTPALSTTQIGCNYNGTIRQNEPPAGTALGEMLLYNRALSVPEVTRVSTNTWQIFQP